MTAGAPVGATSMPGACMLCASRASERMAAADYITGRAFAVRWCRSCGFGATEGVPEVLDEFYPRRYRQYEGVTRTTLKSLYAWKIRQWCHGRRPGLALEVGCGEGWMLAALRQRGWRVLGNERSLEGGRAAVAVNRIPIFVGGLEAIRIDARVNLLILFQVLEHLADAVPTLRRCAVVLDPAGTIVVAVPNSASWQARLFGRHWFHLDVPRHVNHFSPQALRVAFEHAGLRVERVRFVSFEHDPYGWIQSTLNALGFKQNLLTKWIMGMHDDAATPSTIVLMMAISAVLAVPGVLLSVLSWGLGAGALIEVWGAKAQEHQPV